MAYKCPKCGHSMDFEEKRSKLPLLLSVLAVLVVAGGALATAPRWLPLLRGELPGEEAGPSEEELARLAALEAERAEAERLAQEEERRRRAEQQAREVWLKAQAEYLEGNLELATEILATVPEVEGVQEDVEELRERIEGIQKDLRRGKAAAWRGDCHTAISIFNRILNQNPKIRDASTGRQACRNMLPPEIVD